jgi:hypothetical protein
MRQTVVSASCDQPPRRRDVLVESEDVVRVPALLHLDKAGEGLGVVGGANAFGPFVLEAV